MVMRTITIMVIHIIIIVTCLKVSDMQAAYGSC
jgi:hypothetical protein